MGFRGPSKKSLAPEVHLKEGPCCRAPEAGREGSGGDSQSLPRGKINFNYFSHAAWLFTIYNLVILPFTGATPGNNPLNFPEEMVFISPTSSFMFPVLFTSELSHCFCR